MSLLTAADLSFMQETQAEALPGTVVIERYTRAVDGQGGVYETWAAVGTVVGRVYPRSRMGMGEQVAGAQVMSITDWWGTLPSGTDVTAKDRLYYSNRTWEVVLVNNDEMWSTAVRCECRAMNEERRT